LRGRFEKLGGRFGVQDNISEQPLVRYAASVTSGSMLPLDRSQHIHILRAPLPAKTAHSCRWPMGHDAAVRPVRAAVRCKRKKRSKSNSQTVERCYGSPYPDVCLLKNLGRTAATAGRPSVDILALKE